MKKKLKSKLPTFSSQKTRGLSLRKQTIIGTVAIMTLGLATVSDSRLAKMTAEITKIVIENKFPVCQQYALIVLLAGNYPCHECEDGEIYLKREEVWRYGFAGMGGQNSRYPNGIFYKEGKWLLDKRHLRYEIQLEGTKPECEIEEKLKIYAYPTLPEAKKRAIKLIRPPGNKQDR